MSLCPFGARSPKFLHVRRDNRLSSQAVSVIRGRRGRSTDVSTSDGARQTESSSLPRRCSQVQRELHGIGRVNGNCRPTPMYPSSHVLDTAAVMSMLAHSQAVALPH